jgi:choline dehydrogenase-like flavoprotein
MSACDVIVIRSGAGGDTLVHRLAPSGKRILLLERGPASVEPAPSPAQAVR